MKHLRYNIINAHRAIESLTLDKEASEMKLPKYASQFIMVYGFHERIAMQKLMTVLR